LCNLHRRSLFTPESSAINILKEDNAAIRQVIE
jgi:hypothetical protein